MMATNMDAIKKRIDRWMVYQGLFILKPNIPHGLGLDNKTRRWVSISCEAAAQNYLVHYCEKQKAGLNFDLIHQDCSHIHIYNFWNSKPGQVLGQDVKRFKIVLLPYFSVHLWSLREHLVCLFPHISMLHVQCQGPPIPRHLSQMTGLVT